MSDKSKEIEKKKYITIGEMEKTTLEELETRLLSEFDGSDETEK